MNIFTFGDSITEGLWDSNGGWADRLKVYIHKAEVETGFRNYHQLFNLGIDGNTTKQVLERFDVETQARLWPDSEYGFIFATGTNDTLHRNKHDFESTPETYSSQLSELVKKANKYSNKILFVDMTPVNESLTNPFASSSTGKCYTNDRIDEFNKALHDFCKTRSFECVRVSEAFKTREAKTLLAVDGLHPNDDGHTLIFNLVLPCIKKWL